MASMVLQSAEVLHDGRSIRLVFSAATPAARGAVDWKPGYVAGVQRSLSTGAAFYFSGGSPVVNGGNLEWHVRLLIRTPSDRIIFGQSGITISAGAGWLQDGQGNSSAAITSFSVTNYSYVNSSGFLADIPLSGTAVTRYVSWTNGNNANDGSLLAPWKTLNYAQTQLFDMDTNVHANDGSRILLLEGDRWPVGVDFSWNQGASFARPFVLGHYWHDYGTGGVGTGQQGVRPSIRPSNGALGMHRTGGGGRPASLSYVIVDGLECSFPTSNGDGGSGGLICQMPDAHWMLIDCRTLGGVTGIEIAANGTAHHMSVVRCIILDTYEEMSPGGSSTGSGLHLAHVDQMLVSELTIDRCGMQEPTLTYGGSRSRNIYPDVSVPHLAYWGGYNCRSSSEAVQVRGDGDVYGVIIDDCSQAGFIQHGGGRICMNVTLRIRDANYWNTTTLAGYSVPLGWNWYVGYDSGSHSIEQDGVDGAMEGCIIECCGAGPSLSTASGRCFALNWNNTPDSQSRHIYRNNTAIGTMMIYYSGDGVDYLPESFTTSRNLCSNSISPFNCLNHVAASYASYAWMANDNNCFHSSNAAKTVVMNSDGTDYTLAAYTTLTGQETHSITTAPVFVNSAASLASWYAVHVGGSPTIEDFYTTMRTRAMGAWPSWMDSLAAARYFLSQFQNTNLSVVANDVLGMYGVPTDDPSYLNPGTEAVTTSYRIAESGILSKIHGEYRVRRILVIGGAGLQGLINSWIKRCRPAAGFVGCTVSGNVADLDTIFTKTNLAATNLSRGVYLDTFRIDQPNAPGESYGKFWDTSAAAGDGSAGSWPAVLAGTKENIWAQAANVALDAQLQSCVLAAHTQVRSPNWYKDALTCRFFDYCPAADAGVPLPILGGPSLKLGTRRAGGSYTLGSASSAPTTAQLRAIAGTIAAGSGLPDIGVFNGLAAGNLARRDGPAFFQIESSTAASGISLTFVVNPEIGFDGWSGLTEGMKHQYIADLAAVQGAFDAVVWHMGEYLPDGSVGFSTGSPPWNDVAAELLANPPGAPGDNNDVAESIADGANMIYQYVGVVPILYVIHPYLGWGGESAQDLATINEHFIAAVRRVCSPAELGTSGGSGLGGNHSPDNLYGQPYTGYIVPATSPASADAFIDEIWTALEAASLPSMSGRSVKRVPIRTSFRSPSRQ